MLVDPEGYVVHTASGEGHGEGHGEGLGALLAQLVTEHDAKGTLRRGGPAWVPPPAPTTTLRFPARVLALSDGRLLVLDTAHHQLVVLTGDGERELARIGTGERGLLDGPAPRFAEPQGACLAPDGRVLVADTANSVLRAVDLDTGTARTVAGTGAVRPPGAVTAGPALEVDLSSPWDVCWYGGEVVVAMAGSHQLWAYDGERVRVLAGTTGEGLRDGDALRAYLAQPSGLADGGDRLWFVDAETSALRWYRAGPDGAGQVGTAVGAGLFEFGHRDGPADQALLEHPLGVCVLPDAGVAVLDTYNGAIRRYHRRTGCGGCGCRTRSCGATRSAPRVRSAPSRPARWRLQVAFDPPPGRHLDERDGPATRLAVSASPASLLLSGGGVGSGLSRDLVLAAAGEGVLHVAATAASCDVDGEHPACHLTQQDWGIPVCLQPGAPAALHLVLRCS